MEQEVSFLSFILWLMGDLVFFVIALLVLRYAAKLKWLKAICLSVFATTIILILNLRILRGPSPKMGLILLLAVVCAVIMITQFFRWLISSDNASINTAERDRILKMVEEGKINAEEGTELLDAMGRSSALRGEEKFSRVDMTMLMGAALVVLGFFLPWAYVNWTKQIPGSFARVSGYQAGYHVGAIGWAVFIIAVLSAVPVFVTPRNFLYKISMLQIFLILLGLVLVVSVLIRVGENLGAGLIFCLVGFIVELISSGAKLKNLAA